MQMTTLDDWTQLAAEIKPRTEIFINGDFRAATSGATFDSVNPATGDLIAPVSSADSADVDAAVASARAAFEAGSWSRASAGHRKKVLQRLAELITEHSRELALLDSIDMGKLVEEAHNVDVPPTCSRSTAKRSTSVAARSPPPNPATSPW
jgi:gamma-glutamyl-gamma-aminobutyraldehyde dehydrogenase